MGSGGGVVVTRVLRTGHPDQVIGKQGHEAGEGVAGPKAPVRGRCPGSSRKGLVVGARGRVVGDKVGGLRGHVRPRRTLSLGFRSGMGATAGV